MNALHTTLLELGTARQVDARQLLLRAGEVDVLRLRVLPMLLGRGRSFAPSDLGLRRLSLVTAQPFAGGLVVLEYSLAP